MLLLVLPAALALSGCVATPQPGITNSDTPPQVMSAQASAATTSAPLETTPASNKAPVYWIGRSNDNTFLYREFRDVPEQDNPVTRALRVMMVPRATRPRTSLSKRMIRGTSAAGPLIASSLPRTWTSTAGNWASMKRRASS